MKDERENGEVVVEASIVVTIVVLFISIMLYIGMVLYQQTAISVVSNRIATDLSLVYSNTLRDPFTGYIDPDNAYQSITYSNMKTDAYLDAIKQKGTAFAQYRFKKSQILPTTDREVHVQIVKKQNELFKGQIVVTIKDFYDVPLVGFFGLDGKLGFSATGRADCVDYLEYLLGVEAIANPEDSPIPSLPDSDTCIVTFIKDKSLGGFHAAVPVLRGKSIITSNNHSHSTMPDNPMLNGMEFTGWVTEDGGNFSASIQVNENMTVYGTWKCTITFDPTGGTVDPTHMTVDYNKTTVFPTPERYGYAFEGWYTEKDGGGIRYESGVTEIPGNTTLYAKWRCIHAAFDVTLKDAGNCTTRSTWLHSCKTCDYSYEDRGDYNYSGHNYAPNGSDYDVPIRREATCWREGIDGSRCSRCSAEKGTVLPLKEHTWKGRCGKTHELTGDNVKTIASHNTSAGYQYSIEVECYLCSECRAPYNGWDTEKVDVNGTVVSKGVICRKHINKRNDGVEYSQYDGSFPLNYHQNMHVHG